MSPLLLGLRDVMLPTTTTSAVVTSFLCLIAMLAYGSCLPRYNIIAAINGGTLADNYGGASGVFGHKYVHRPLVSPYGGGGRSLSDYTRGTVDEVGAAADIDSVNNVMRAVINKNMVPSDKLVGDVPGSETAGDNSAGVLSSNIATATAASANALRESSLVSGGEVLVPKTSPTGSQEPTCEQLRSMWIFSKRQSRAAEMTNEIPTYYDPFAHNVWKPYFSTTRSMGAVRILQHYGDRSHSPIFGRVVSREPLVPQNLIYGSPHEHRRLSESGMGGPDTRTYGADPNLNGMGQTPRSLSQYRLLRANGPTSVGNPNAIAQVQGSFQKLKELIWTERTKGLTHQRRAEETAARVAALKDIANGHTLQPIPYMHPLKSESVLMDENRSPDRDELYQQYMNDGRRATIASGTSQGTYNRNNNKMHASKNENRNRFKSSARNYAKSFNGAHKTHEFSGSKNNNGNSAPHLIPPKHIPSTTVTLDGRGHGGKHGSSGSISTPKVNPMWPFHFQERNHSLFKLNPSIDYFQREIRQQRDPAALNAENLFLDLDALQRSHRAEQNSNPTRQEHWPRIDDLSKEHIPLQHFGMDKLDLEHITQPMTHNSYALLLSALMFSSDMFARDPDPVHNVGGSSDPIELSSDDFGDMASIMGMDGLPTKMKYVIHDPPISLLEGNELLAARNYY